MDEAARLQSLTNLGVLDTRSESVFDGLVEVAALVCNVPISLISLIDVERQWFKANIGLPGVTETAREYAFCAHTINDNGVLEVNDAARDPRFSDNPLVTGEPNIRFYAGATIVLSNGAHIGSLCVIDDKPNKLDQSQRSVLCHLANAAAQILETRKITRELGVSESRFRALCDASPLGVFGTDAAGACTYANARWQEIFGLTQDEALGYGWSKTLHADDKSAVFSSWNESAVQGKKFDMEFRIACEHGTTTNVRAVSSPVIDKSGVLTGHVGLVENVTEVLSQRIALAEQHELLQVTLSSITDGVITTDRDGLIDWLNPVAESMTGWATIDAKGRHLVNVYNVVNEHTRALESNSMDECMSGRKTITRVKDTVLISRSQVEYGIEDSAAPIINSAGVILGAVLVFHDVTEKRRLLREMKYRASHDSLTALLSRSEFESTLQSALADANEHGSVHALMFIDLDRFKLVNDACGHAVGDILLRQVSKILQECVRSSDALARIGGDEFTVILRECSLDQAQSVADLICKSVDDYRFTYADQQFRIGASIGLVPLDSRWVSMSAALQAADRSCYAAKKAGRNRVNIWLDNDQNIKIQQEDMQWATRIQQALDRNRFQLYAQHIVSLKSDHRGAHFEVLLRMMGNSGELISPGVFFSAAERFQLASLIDCWVLENSLLYLSGLSDLSDVEMMCINLSGQSIGDRDFHGKTIDALNEVSLEICSKICFEITETSAITNITDASLFINRVRELGVRVALDDFGSGASSFSYLKKLDVDILKIDGQFITGMIDDKLDDSAVRCFIDVAGILGIETVAEFVDSHEVLNQVKFRGIDYAQGFLLHKPEKLESMVASVEKVAV